jgi:parvulin-like peptidyl-prolyl isomerase
MVSFAVVFLMAIVFSGCSGSQQPPNPDTAAVFNGGRIMRQEVQDAIDKLSKHFGEEKEAVEQLHNTITYKRLITGMILERMVKRKIKAMKMDSRKNIKHVMKHVSEELNIDQMHSRAHESQIEVRDEEIRNRYNQNRSSFGQITLAQATNQIRRELQEEKEERYFENYLADLRKNAVITRNDELLEIPPPDEVELRAYYEENKTFYPGKLFEDVQSLVFEKVHTRNRQKWFEENGSRTLMTIHGKRFTLGEFYEEFMELTDAEKERYKNIESMKTMLDRLIDRLLIVEDTYDQMLSSETRNDLDHIREDILRKVLHQEEVDDKIQITEKEIRVFYEKNSAAYVKPPRVQISYIRLSSGQTDADQERAEKKIKEAYAKLKPGLFKDGAPFATIAMQYSEDPETAKDGGALDEWISEEANIIAEIANHGFHENVLGLGENEISRPFIFHGSYYIVQVRKRQDPSPMPFEEARKLIEAELKARKHEVLTRDMEKTLLEQANLVIFEPVIEAMLAKDG